MHLGWGGSHFFDTVYEVLSKGGRGSENLHISMTSLKNNPFILISGSVGGIYTEAANLPARLGQLRMSNNNQIPVLCEKTMRENKLDLYI